MKSRDQQLDMLRGIAILLVLGRHVHYLQFWHGIGWSGVDLFFVLSGFLISGLLFSEYKNTGRINVKRFWIRRAFKIYPPFYGLILLTVVYFLIWYKTVPRALLGDIFFVQNYVPGVWGHGWSLAVEEHFYIALPLLLMLMIRFSKDKENPFRRIPLISICLTILCLYLRVSASHRTVEWERLAFPTHLRVDALFAGVALGYFNHFDSKAFRQPPSLSIMAGWAAPSDARLPFRRDHVHQHDRADICLCRIWLHRGVGSKPAAVAQPRSEAAGLDWLLFLFDLPLARRACDLCFPEASANRSHVCGLSLCLYRPWCCVWRKSSRFLRCACGIVTFLRDRRSHHQRQLWRSRLRRCSSNLVRRRENLLEIFRFPL